MKQRSFAESEPAITYKSTSPISPRLRGLTPRSPRFKLLTFASAALALLVVLSACSTEGAKPAETAKPESKAPELLTGRSAFWKSLISARGWAVDVQPYRIASVTTKEGNGHDGKWAIWSAGFASPAKRSSKPYQWSGSAETDAPARGVSPGNEDTYSPSNATTHVFDVAFLKKDSDEAFATAQKHGGDKILEKDPDTPVIYICDWNHNTNELVWHVIYGASRDSAKLTVAVNASTGDFIRVEK